jgi:NADH-quinone oxidoreductase subunit L
MMGLVLSANLFQIYIFWELVGVSSFLLIGYYYQKPSAVAAAKKAFIVTRFADLGFLIGILVLGYEARSLDFLTLIERLTAIGDPDFQAMIAPSFLGCSAVTWGLALVFMGGMGKSAMFPLHIWLPDAMEGPTPVSALIHAATMVVAGVFLLARLFPVYAIAAPHLLSWITGIGVFSALFAAIIATTQTDIKRVLAYSTMSQIGYMMFSLGIARGEDQYLGYTASLFHLFTHAFFKSLLFLGAGAVIHLIHSNEIDKMGGLRKYMPVTHISFLIACLAIAGIFPFAGFFSKEEILLATYHANRPVFVMALITSGLTAFYMFRLYFSIFWGKSQPTDPHHTEGTATMKIPLIVLMLCTIVVGFLPFSAWVFRGGSPLASHIDWKFSLIPLTLSGVGIVLAAYFYRKPSDRASEWALVFGGIYRAASNKFYIDEVYRWITQQVLFPLIGKPFAWFDKHIVDGTVNGVGTFVGSIYYFIRGMQSGKLQDYLFYFMAGIAAWMIFFFYIWK